MPIEKNLPEDVDRHYRNLISVCLSGFSIFTLILWVMVAASASQIIDLDEPVPWIRIARVVALTCITAWWIHKAKHRVLFGPDFFGRIRSHVPILMSLLFVDVVVVTVATASALQAGRGADLTLELSAVALCLVAICQTVVQREQADLKSRDEQAHKQEH